jgi:hypothetical protein
VYAKGTNLSLNPIDYGDTSLVGYWPLDEGTGTIAYDWSGNNATGSWNGTASGTSGYYSPGKIGSWAGAFNGGNDYIITNSSSSLNSSAITVLLWIYPTSNSQYGTAIARSNGECPANETLAFKWRIAVQNLEFWRIADSSCGDHTINTSIMPINQWSQIALTYDGLLMKAYINGILNASVVTSFTPKMLTSTSSLSIGANEPSAVENFPGLIDDVRVYNRALLASEIAAMYAGGK